MRQPLIIMHAVAFVASVVTMSAEATAAPQLVPVPKAPAAQFSAVALPCCPKKPRCAPCAPALTRSIKTQPTQSGRVYRSSTRRCPAASH